MPERAEDEILYGLAVEDEQRRYSDWRIVSEYATYVYDQMAGRRRRFSAAVCQALIDCLRHPQTFVWHSAATALGGFDRTMARDALLDKLTENALPTDVRNACLQALQHQLWRAPNSPSRQLLRFLFLHASQIARHHGVIPTARRLTELALERMHHEDGWLVEQQALEVMTHSAPNLPVVLQVAVDDSIPVDRAIEVTVKSFGAMQIGPNLEEKYRFVNIHRGLNQLIHITLAPTTWSDANQFTTALRRDPGLIRHRQGGAWIEPVPLGKTVLPGIAAVHAIILTADNQVILTQRSSHVNYAPLHWSASFEEQLNKRDLHHEADPFTQAAARGFREELGGHITPDRLTVLSLILQVDLLNLSVVVLLRPDLTVAEIKERWRSGPQEGWEIKELRSIPIDSLNTLTTSNYETFTPLHVTSRLRCSLLQRWLATR